MRFEDEINFDRRWESPSLDLRGLKEDNKFLQAGFNQGVLARNLSSISLIDREDNGFITQGALGFLGDITKDNTEGQHKIIRSIFSDIRYTDGSTIKPVFKTIQDSLDGLEGSLDPEVIRAVVTSVLDPRFGELEASDAFKTLRPLLDSVNNPGLMEIFDNDINNFTSLMEKYKDSRYPFSRFIALVENVAEDEFVRTALGKGGWQVLMNLPISLHRLEHVNTKGRAEIAHSRFTSEDVWSNKIFLLLQFMSQEDFPVISPDIRYSKLASMWADKQLKALDLAQSVKPEMLNFFNSQPREDRLASLFFEQSALDETGIREFRKQIVEEATENGQVDFLKLAGISESVVNRIRRRENPLHPLNTLGVAVLTGYEIEYWPGPVAQTLTENSGFGFISMLGFKEGGGGMGCIETAPGPFRDPLTEKVVFNCFSNSEIINFRHERYGMHLNIGTRIIPTERYAIIIRAIQSSGFGCFPKTGFTRNSMCIGYNDDSAKGSERTESKDLDVITPEGVDWLADNALYLVWAAEARSKAEKGRDLNIYDKKLAMIWEGFEKDLREGEESLLKGEIYFGNLQNHSDPVEIVTKQLGHIFQSPMDYYGKVSRFTKDTNSNIIPVKLGKRQFSNVAEFTRFVVEKHAAKIIKLADKVEEDCIKDIERVDKLPESRRINAMKSFIRKYKVPNVDLGNKESVKEGFLKVRSVFF